MQAERFLFHIGRREGCYVWGTYFGFYCCIWMDSQRDWESWKPSRKKKAFSASQVLVFWGKWLHRFNQARLNSRDGPSGPSLYHCFHLHFPSLAASACFLSEISPMWQLMCHWDPTDSCQPPHLEANCRDGEQQASFPADKNTNMNCCYYYPIFHPSHRPRPFNHLPSWVVNRGAKEPANLPVYIHHIKSKY